MRVNRLDRDPHDLDGPDDRSRTLSRDELLANTVLLNGARLYNDHNHPEYCTEATPDLFELVAQDRAGEVIVLACEVARNAALALEVGPNTRVRLLKNNTDYHGRSYGMHENYLCARSTPLDDLVRGMTPHLVTRQLFVGAGKLGFETPGKPIAPGFQLSQRGDFFEERVGINTTAKRPIFNTRDEPHSRTSSYRRLHCIAGDANRSEWATAMKVGTTSLVLDLIEGHRWTPLFDLADPVTAIRLFSRNPRATLSVPTTTGKSVTIHDVQASLYETCSGVFARRDAETDWVLEQWRLALDAAATRDADGQPGAFLRTRADWAIKWAIFSQVSGGSDETTWGDAKLRRLDLSYHVLDPGSSVFDTLRRQHRVTSVVDPDRIMQARQSPPSATRGAIRGALLSRFGPSVRTMEWDSVTFTINGREWRLDLEDLTGPVVDRVLELVEAAPNLSGFVAAMKGSSRNA
jgi:proteasome accessory factor A